MGVQSQLARTIAHRTGVDVRVCVTILAEAARTIWDEWKRCRPVHYPLLGTFGPAYREPRRVVCNLPGKEGKHNIGTRKTMSFRVASNPELKRDYGGMIPHDKFLNQPSECLFCPNAERPFDSSLNPHIKKPRSVRPPGPRPRRARKPWKMPWERKDAIPFTLEAMTLLKSFRPDDRAELEDWKMPFLDVELPSMKMADMEPFPDEARDGLSGVVIRHPNQSRISNNPKPPAPDSRPRLPLTRPRRNASRFAPVQAVEKP